MAIVARQLVVKVVTDTKAAETGLKNIDEQANKADGGTKGFLGTMAAFAGGTALVSAAGDAFGFLKDQVTDSLRAGMNANLVEQQTVAGLKSTHDASGMTAQSVDDLAKRIMGMSGIQDDAVQTGENMLLTFTNIGKGVFPQATQAIADMATKMNGGLIPSSQQVQQQAILVGKALGDPTKGLTALTRVGVTFTDQQKEQIKTMQAHGDMAGAQTVILKELNKEFGGSAAAAGKANGGIGILTAQLDNAKQTIGQALIPVVTQLTGAVTPLVTQFAASLPGAMRTATAWINANLKPAMAQIGSVITTQVAPAVKDIAEKIGQFASYLSTHQAAMDAFKAGLAAVAIVIATVLVASFVAWAVAAASAAIATIAAALPVIAVGLAIALLIIGIKALVDHWSQITSFLRHVWQAAMEKAGAGFSWLGSEAHALLSAIVGVFTAIPRRILEGMLLARGHILLWIAEIQAKFDAFVKQAEDWGKNLIQNFINGISGMVNNVKNAASNLMSGVKSILGFHSPAEEGPGADADTWAPNLMRMFAAGLTAAAPDLARAATTAMGGVRGALTGVGGVNGNLSAAAASGLVAPSAASQLTQALGASGATISGAGGAGGGQPVILMLDGLKVGTALLPHLGRAARIATGVRTM